MLCVVMMLSLVLASCDDQPEGIAPPQAEDPNHQHTFSEDWTVSETHHWHAATCTHTDERSDYEEHDIDANGYCATCQHQIYVQSEGFTLYNDQSNISDAKVLPEPTNAPQSKTSVAIHYRRLNSAEYKTWGFWIWTAGQDGRSYTMKYQDDFGGIAYFPLKEGQENARFGLIPVFCDGVETETWVDATWKKDDAGADRFFEPDDFKFNDQTNCYDIYILAGDIALYRTVEESNYVSLNYGMKANFTSTDKIDMQFASAVSNVAVLENDEVVAQIDTSSTKTVHVAYQMTHGAVLTNNYTIRVTFTLNSFEKTGGVSISYFYDTAEFANAFNYDGDDLGATLDANSTTFKVWSPVSTRMVLKLYYQGDGGSPYAAYNMALGEQGVWEYTVPERLAGVYYTYTVYNGDNPNGMEICDPYAKSAGLNGRRGMVVDFNSTLAKPEGWDAVVPKEYDANELVVWETHVADVTSSETWQPADPTHENYRKTFLGMIEPGTTYTSGGTTVKTGFDHIKELGVNAVQLIPVFDQSNEETEKYRSFNWGYNPLNYNVLEGSYSTNPRDGYTRVKEFRQLVMAFNNIDVNIIMDVVYNHVNEVSGCNFETLMPGYYFRRNSDGSYSNGSGCVNDTMSERPMFRKFMIDSVCFLAETYQLGGFRFDIMGLHDVETMNLLTEAVRRINPNMILFGEAWDSNSNNTASTVALAGQSHANDFADGLGQFNDRMRDQVTNFAAGKKYTEQRILDGFVGGTTEITSDPYKTVNYVTCHDGFTLNDLFANNGTVSGNDKRAMLSQSMILTSNGISFILAGEEFLRTKGGNKNSYNASYEVNELDYALKIEHADMFANYQKLIAFKQKFTDEFELDSKENIQNIAKYKVNLSDGIFWIDIYATDGTHWVIAHAGPSATGTIALKTLYLSTTGNTSLTSVQPYETKIGTV